LHELIIDHSAHPPPALPNPGQQIFARGLHWEERFFQSENDLTIDAPARLIRRLFDSGMEISGDLFKSNVHATKMVPKHHFIEPFSGEITKIERLN
jgi:hypothetical protein